MDLGPPPEWLRGLHALDHTKLLLAGGAVLFSLAFVLYLTIFNDLPTLKDSTVEIDYNPPGLPPAVNLGILLKIAAKSLPVVGCAPLKPNKSNTGYDLPELELRAPLHVDIGFLRTYLKAVDSVLEKSVREKLEKEHKSWIAERKDLPKRVPPFFLTAVTSAMFIILCAHAQTPFGSMGIVNTANTYEWVDPAALDSFEAFSRRDWVVIAKMGGVMSRRKRGAETALTVELQDRKSGEVVFRSTWKIIKFLPKSAKPAHDPSKDPTDERRQASDVAQTPIKLSPSAQSPRLWARSCGDWNPIHISGLAAKAFGLPAAIAHGNLMVAATFRALEVLDPDGQVNKTVSGKRPFEVDAAFRSMMQVGKTFSVHADANGQYLVVGKGDKVCTEGSARLK